MSEKKISKAEQRKLDSANKKEFIGKVFQTALNALGERTVGVTGGTKVQIVFTNHNRYIHLNAYGRATSILIYRDGNVDLKLTEAFHSPHEERIFEFTLDKTEQENFLKHFSEMLNWLIPVSFENCAYDFHTFMDYVSGSTSVDAAYETISKEWGEVNAGRS